MEIKEMQAQALQIVEEYNKKHGIEHHKETVFHHLVEEIGELAREIAKETNDWRKEGFNKEKLATEIVDCISQLLYLAKDYDVDIEETFKKKIIKLRERYELDGN